MPGAFVIHSTTDDFYAAVEQRDQPSLFRRPLLIASRGPSRILGASREARARGVRSGMDTSRARELCPDATTVAPRFAAYLAAHEELMAAIGEGGGSVDEVTTGEAYCEPDPHEHRSAKAVAAELRASAFRRVGLDLSVGVARTPYLAKVASTSSERSGVTAIEPGQEREFLRPVPIRRLWDIGPSTADRLSRRGIETVGDVAAAGEAVTVSAVGGPTGRHLHAVALGHDPRPVARNRRRTITVQAAAGDGDSRPSLLIVSELTDRLAGRLVESGVRTRTVSLRLRYGDLTTSVRTRSVRHATDRSHDLQPTVDLLMRAAGPDVTRRGLLVIGLSSEIIASSAPDQPSLPLPLA